MAVILKNTKKRLICKFMYMLSISWTNKTYLHKLFDKTNINNVKYFYHPLFLRFD